MGPFNFLFNLWVCNSYMELCFFSRYTQHYPKMLYFLIIRNLIPFYLFINKLTIFYLQEAIVYIFNFKFSWKELIFMNYIIKLYRRYSWNVDAIQEMKQRLHDYEEENQTLSLKWQGDRINLGP